MRDYTKPCGAAPAVKKFMEEYKKQFGRAIYLTTDEENKIIAITKKYPEIADEFPYILEEFKKTKYRDKDGVVKHSTLRWLLEFNGWAKIMRGEHVTEIAEKYKLPEHLRDKPLYDMTKAELKEYYSIKDFSRQE